MILIINCVILKFLTAAHSHALCCKTDTHPRQHSMTWFSKKSVHLPTIWTHHSIPLSHYFSSTMRKLGGLVQGEDKSLYLSNWVNSTYIPPEWEVLQYFRKVLLHASCRSSSQHFYGLNILMRICSKPYRTSNQMSVPGSHYLNSSQSCTTVWMVGFCRTTLNLNMVLTVTVLPQQNPSARVLNYSFPNGFRNICNILHMLL